jgi:hypothetical protein
MADDECEVSLSGMVAMSNSHEGSGISAYNSASGIGSGEAVETMRGSKVTLPKVLGKIAHAVQQRLVTPDSGFWMLVRLANSDEQASLGHAR